MYRKNVDRQEITESGGSIENGNVQRGTKDLMRLIKNAGREEIEEIEDASAIEIKDED